MKKYSTDNVSYKTFRPHGRVEFSVVDENIIIYRAWGPFNSEFFSVLEAIEPDALIEVQSNVRSWGEVVVFEDSCMAVDNFFLEFSAYLKSMKARDLVPIASAYVFSNNIEGGLLMKDKYKKCYQDAGLVFSTFADEETALSWIKSCF
ncbi:hypothetical protein [Psychromonas aquimarina]|uniref:hypothetical protein n=1 Tax=Psychromonas aquimarina TaxID=444919 RepID=UPI0004918AB8|nr:hypothetical protein [Psychromonas aquimarina]